MKTQEFLILRADGRLAVHGVRSFPPGTPVGRDARRLRIVGESWVQPPRKPLTEPEFERWRQELKDAGSAVTIGPFWTDPEARAKSESAYQRGEFLSLKDAFDELLRGADGRRETEDQRMESVKSRHS